MEKDPLRWHGGIKVSMAVALNEGMQGLIQNFPTVSNVVQMTAFCTQNDVTTAAILQLLPTTQIQSQLCTHGFLWRQLKLNSTVVTSFWV